MYFGDDKHNGVNIPARYYEALVCGVKVKVHPDLQGAQVINNNPTLESIYNNLVKVLPRIQSHVRKGSNTHVPDNEEQGQLYNSTDTDKILENRASFYGSYAKGVDCRAKILTALNEKHKETHNGEPLSADMVVMFSDLILKTHENGIRPFACRFLCRSTWILKN